MGVANLPTVVEFVGVASAPEFITTMREKGMRTLSNVLFYGTRTALSKEINVWEPVKNGKGVRSGFVPPYVKKMRTATDEIKTRGVCVKKSKVRLYSLCRASE